MEHISGCQETLLGLVIVNNFFEKQGARVLLLLFPRPRFQQEREPSNIDVNHHCPRPPLPSSL